MEGARAQRPEREHRPPFVLNGASGGYHRSTLVDQKWTEGNRGL